MADMKTRDISKRTIKTTDKAALISAQMKRAYIYAKERAENSGVGAENSADEYALDRYERSVDAAAYEGIRKIDKAGRKGLSPKPMTDTAISYKQKAPSPEPICVSRFLIRQLMKWRLGTASIRSRKTSLPNC